MKSASFIEGRGEDLNHGGWSSFENILFVEVMDYLREDDPTTEEIHHFFNELVKCVPMFGLQLPGSSKSRLAIAAKMQKFEKLRQTFLILTNPASTEP